MPDYWLPFSLLIFIYLFICFLASVFSVAIDPVSSSLAVSGGEDDKAFIWRIQNGETLLECQGVIISNIVKSN